MRFCHETVDSYLVHDSSSHIVLQVTQLAGLFTAASAAFVRSFAIVGVVFAFYIWDIQDSI